MSKAKFPNTTRPRGPLGGDQVDDDDDRDMSSIVGSLLSSPLLSLLLKKNKQKKLIWRFEQLSPEVLVTHSTRDADHKFFDP